MSKTFRFSKKPRRGRFLRVLPIALTVFVTVMIATYCLSWYFQASYAKGAVERMISDFNSGQNLITYSAIETSGFPLDVNVRVVQPKFSARVDVLLKQAQKSPAAQQDKAWQRVVAKLPEWIEEVTWSGGITIGSNFFSDMYTLEMDGPIAQVSVINGDRSKLVLQQNSALSCMLQLARKNTFLSDLWDVGRVASTTVDDFMHEFRMVSCYSPGYTITEEATKENMLRSGLIGIRFENTPLENGQRGIQWITRVTDYEFSQRMNSIINRYLALFSELPGAVSNIDFAAYGKQNIDVSIAMRGPADMRAFTDESPFSVNVERFNISNALYNTATSLTVDNHLQGESRNITFTMNSNSGFTKAFDKYLADYVRIFIDQIKNSDDPSVAELKQSLADFTATQTADIMQPAIPRLHTLGNITVRINATVEGDRVLRKGNLTITNLDVATTPYGFSLQGKTPLPGDNENRFITGASFMLSCRNCTMMVDDAAGYSRRAQQVMGTLDNSLADSPPYVSSQLAQGVKNFITTLGEKRQDATTGAESLAYTLSSDQAGNLTLNGRTPQAIGQLYTKYIVPYLPNGPDGAQEQQPSSY